MYRYRLSPFASLLRDVCSAPLAVTLIVTVRAVARSILCNLSLVSASTHPVERSQQHLISSAHPIQRVVLLTRLIAAPEAVDDKPGLGRVPALHVHHLDGVPPELIHLTVLVN